MPTDLAAIEQKVERGEELTPEEKEEVMGGAPDTENPEDEEQAPEKPEEGEEKTGKKEPEAEEKEGEEDEEEEEGEEESEETPSEKDAEEAEAKEKEAQEAAAKEAERKKSIEAEAEKPLDEADISNYSPTERALFYELRRERRKRQDAQRETDVLKFQRLKEERERREKAAKEEQEAAGDPFEGMAEDDIVTVAQMKKMMQGRQDKGKTAGKEEESENATPPMDPAAQQFYTENCILKGQQKHKDLMEVLQYADELLDGDKNAEAEVADVIRKRGNFAVATYNLIKAHPRWPEIEEKLKAGKGEKTDAEKQKEEEARINKERRERIEKNKKKAVTTGSGGGSASTGEYTYAELDAMTEEEFASLPKAQRDKILERL